MRRDNLPSNARRRPSQTMHFGAQSRGLRAPCERFAPWVTPGPRITRFRLAADLGRMGLDTHRVSNKVSKITSRHLVPLDRAFPAHALVHEAPAGGGALLGTLRRGHTTGMKSKVHPRYKTKYRVANWAAYNRALVRRGDVTGRCCMKDLLRVGRFGPPFSSPQEPHCRDAVEGSSHV